MISIFQYISNSQFKGKGEKTTYWLISEDPFRKSERNIIRNRLLSNCGLGCDEFEGNFLRASPNSVSSQNGGLLQPPHQLHRLSNHSNGSNRSSRNQYPVVSGVDVGDVDRSSVRSDAVVYDLFRSSDNASIRRGSSRKSFILGLDAIFRIGSPPHNEILSNAGHKDDQGRQKWGFKSSYTNQYNIQKQGRSGSKIGASSEKFLKVPFATKSSSFKCSPTSSSHSISSMQRNSLTDENTWLKTRPKTASNRLIFKKRGEAGKKLDSGSPLL